MKKAERSKKEEPLYKQLSPNSYIEVRDDGGVSGQYHYTDEEGETNWKYWQGQDNSARDSNLKRQEQLIERNHDKTFRSLNSYNEEFDKAVAEAQTKRKAKK